MGNMYYMGGRRTKREREQCPIPNGILHHPQTPSNLRAIAPSTRLYWDWTLPNDIWIWRGTEIVVKYMFNSLCLSRTWWARFRWLDSPLDWAWFWILWTPRSLQWPFEVPRGFWRPCRWLGGWYHRFGADLDGRSHCQSRFEPLWFESLPTSRSIPGKTTKPHINTIRIWKTKNHPTRGSRLGTCFERGRTRLRRRSTAEGLPSSGSGTTNPKAYGPSLGLSGLCFRIWRFLGAGWMDGWMSQPLNDREVHRSYIWE